MVPGAGLEPARPCGREILSLLCLPIPPPGLRKGEDFYTAKRHVVNHIMQFFFIFSLTIRKIQMKYQFQLPSMPLFQTETG